MTKVSTDEKISLYCQIVGENIQRLRGKLSQTWLANKAGVSRGTVNSIEKGNSIALDKLIRIAEALGVELPDLFISDKDRKELNYKAKMIVDRISELSKDLIKEIK